MRLSGLATVAGFCSACAGLWLTFGAGVALMVGGAVLFVAGGLAEAGARR